MLLSQLSLPALPCCVHWFVLYVCVSVARGWIPNHWTTREVLLHFLRPLFFLMLHKSWTLSQILSIVRVNKILLVKNGVLGPINKRPWQTWPSFRKAWLPQKLSIHWRAHMEINGSTLTAVKHKNRIPSALRERKSTVRKILLNN